MTISYRPHEARFYEHSRNDSEFEFEKLKVIIESLRDRAGILAHTDPGMGGVNALVERTRSENNELFQNLRSELNNKFKSRADLIETSEIDEAINILHEALLYNIRRDVREVHSRLDFMASDCQSLSRLAGTIKQVLDPEQVYFVFRDGEDYKNKKVSYERIVNDKEELPIPELVEDNDSDSESNLPIPSLVENDE